MRLGDPRISTDGYAAPLPDRRSPCSPGVEVAIDAYLALARELGLDPAQLALAFVTSRKFVTSNIIGATTLQQLDVALGSVQVDITPEIEDAIDAIHQVHQNPAP